MRKIALASGTALLALSAPALAQESDQPEAYPDSSGLDTRVEESKPTVAPPAPTGDPVLDRLNALEARIQQLEARNAELEAAAVETETRVQNVEVRAAKGVQPGPAPTFSDPNDTFTFKPRGTLQIDYAAYNERQGGYDYNNGTDLRRARFGFDGTFLKNFKYRIEAEYVKNTVNLLDAYIQFIVDPRWTLTVGQHKAPYGLEANTSDAFNSFIERGMASNAFGAVAAERRIGASILYTSDHLNAQFGVFGAPEGVQRNTVNIAGATPTPDETYSVNGRITWDPIIDTDRLVHVGASAYSVTNFAGSGLVVSERPNTRVDGGNIVSATIAGTAAAPFHPKSARYFGGEAALVYGPFSLQGEYGNLAIDRANGAADVNFDGFHVFGSWFLTGESRTFKGGNADRVKPFANFDPAKGGWGAFELLARYDQLDLTDGDLSALGRKAETWTAGLNWYLNPNLKFVFNYIRFEGENSPLYVLPTPLPGRGDRTAKGDAFHTRLQVDF